jgi:catechol 2,3-dioxygenase-like lactoylglutathione lyase family enzyme
MSITPPRLGGLHHVTAICRDLERTTAFYRDALGLELVEAGVNDDDPGTRHFWFGAPGGPPGTLVSFLEYPEMAEGKAGAGATHHFAFAVDGEADLVAWVDHLRDAGIPCTEIFERGAFRSVYLRDPDGHIIELATREPGFTG